VYGNIRDDLTSAFEGFLAVLAKLKFNAYQHLLAHSPYAVGPHPKSLSLRVMTRQFWSIKGKAEGSKSLPYGRKIHRTAKVSSGEPSGRGTFKHRSSFSSLALGEKLAGA